MINNCVVDLCMKKINIVFCSFPDFSSNAKALYDYMVKKYKDNMNYIWVVSSDEMLKKLTDKRIETYKLGTKEYFEKMKQIDVFLLLMQILQVKKIIMRYILNYGTELVEKILDLW